MARVTSVGMLGGGEAGVGARTAPAGLPGGTRTPDLLLRRQLLYPVELRSDRFLLYRAVLIQQQLWLLLSVKKGLTNNKPVNP